MVAERRTAASERPASGGLRRPADELSDDARRAWGYIVWGLMGVVIAVPEIWAVVGTPPWSTISATVGHLEARHGFVGLIVVALIVLATARALSFPWPATGPLRSRVRGPEPERTKNGRITRSPAASPGEFQELSPYLYFSLAAGIVVGAALWVISATDDKWVRGYVLYGVIAVLFGVIPNILAMFFKTDVPYPTLFSWIAGVQREFPALALVILVGMVILLIHLALYPWPHIVKAPTPSSP
jgi:hypothetical protein